MCRMLSVESIGLCKKKRKIVARVAVSLLLVFSSLRVNTGLQPPPTGSSVQFSGDLSDALIRKDDVVQSSISFHFKQQHQRRALRSDKHDVKSGYISTALCHKTVFGSIDISVLVKWAAYNKLLGFDHIFIWYLPIMATENTTATGGNWKELESLPYVTLVPNTEGRVKTYKAERNYTRIERGRKGDQLSDMNQCLQDKAKDYDFVLNADSDEFLWFNKKVGLQEFLEPYRDYFYLSFGKHMYTQRYAIETKQDTFGLDQYPFTAGPFCVHGEMVGNDTCPTWFGRAKVMVDPKQRPTMEVHGGDRKLSKKGKIHFSTKVAHMKEWPGLCKQDSFKRTNFRAPEDFELSASTSDFDIHQFNRAHVESSPGYHKLFYDSELLAWFDFISNRGS